MRRAETGYIVVHCSATKADQKVTVDDIRRWHVDERKWSDIGYNWVIERDGGIEQGRNMHGQGAHAFGYNDKSVGICLVGGLDEDGQPEDNFTSEQFESLRKLIDFQLHVYPGAKVLGHRDLPGVHKDCPCFDVRAWRRS
ncbi:N-acetylmuramoyl-L-alanine amidase [Hahella ganghwensis]|uniref:N-acetylmuramoyl-L-alanine amidase n=1 Tax=Hahella ganghwensis TaxID=286420 RepID=UPI00035E1F6C|nr:N-acetylmuramoyl-L-alanine amidase [Hahella ganghwensis]